MANRVEKLASQLSINPTSASALQASEEEKDQILYEKKDGGIALITLNRPKRLNALTGKMQALYFDLLEQARDDPEVKVIIVTGGPRYFSAGAEMELLKTIGKGGDQQVVNQKPPRNTRQNQALRIPKPIIGCISGAAGLGFVLAMHADIRFATAKGKWTTAFAKRGLVVEHGLSTTLSRIIGVSNALDILLSSRVFLGEEAKELGLVSKVFDNYDAMMAHAIAYAQEMAANASPASMAAMKSQVYRHFNMDIDDAYAESEDLMKKSFKHPDSKEGVASYVEKRKPAFQGLAFGRIEDL